MSKKLEKQVERYEKLEEQETGVERKTYPLEKREEAHVLYMRFVPSKEIAKHLDVPWEVINRWQVEHKWYSQREKLLTKYINRPLAELSDALETGMGLAIETLLQYLIGIKARGDAITDKQADRCIKIAEVLGKHWRLEEGKPTEINKQVSAAEERQRIIDVVNADPFEEFKPEIPNDH